MPCSTFKSHSTCSQSISQPVMPVFNILIFLNISCFISAVSSQTPNPPINPGLDSSNKPESHVLLDRKLQISEIVQGHQKSSTNNLQGIFCFKTWEIRILSTKIRIYLHKSNLNIGRKSSSNYPYQTLPILLPSSVPITTFVLSHINIRHALLF